MGLSQMMELLASAALLMARTEGLPKGDPKKAQLLAAQALLDRIQARSTPSRSW
jgi:hypothetical protein